MVEATMCKGVFATVFYSMLRILSTWDLCNIKYIEYNKNHPDNSEIYTRIIG